MFSAPYFGAPYFAAPYFGGVVSVGSELPANPNPAHLAIGVSRTPTVTWTAAPGAVCLVYFGPSPPPWPRSTDGRWDNGNPAGMPTRTARGVEGPAGTFSTTLDLLGVQIDVYWKVLATSGVGPVWKFRTL